jgi:uncharacterized protein (DUF1330 family)
MTIMTRRAVGAATASMLAIPANAQQAPAPDPAPGYMLVMGTTKKPEAMAEYSKLLPPIYARFQGYYVATGRKDATMTLLEGTFRNQSVVLARFPTVETVNEFWWSPEYRAAAKLRIDADAGSFTVIRLKGRAGEGDRPLGKPGILIGIEAVKDPVKLREYGAKAGPLVRAHGGKIIAGGQRKDIESLEGNFGNFQVTVVRFPSLQGLRTFYNDPAYQEAIKIRQAAADSLVLELEGAEFKG